MVVNGVDPEYFAPAPDPGGADVVFVGGMSWYPNRDAIKWFLARVWPAIRRAVPRARFVVVGSHPSPEAQRAAARGTGVAVTGLVPDIRPHVRAAAVYVCPLRVGGGTRLKILDAWAMGKAVVSTAIGAEGLGAVAGREIELADDPAAFAGQVIELLGDPARRLALGSEGRRRAVEEFAWPRVATGLLDLYDELIGEHRSGGQRAIVARGSVSTALSTPAT